MALSSLLCFPRMHRYFLSIKGFFAGVAVVAFLLGVASGCGGSDSSATGSAGGEITVEAGSLSKAEFIAKADALCKDSRAQFDRALRTYTQNNPLSGSAEDETEQLGKVVDTILSPTYENLTEEITSLGAPSGDEEQVAAFVQAIQQDLDEASENPSKAFRDLQPFDEPIKLANAYGLTGCAASLS